MKRRKGKGKGKHRSISKRSGRAFLGEEQAQDSEMWSEEDSAWWTKGRNGKKGLSKGNDGSQSGGFFALTSQIKAQARIIPRTYARESAPKEMASSSSIRTFSLKEKAMQWPDDSWTPAAGWYSTKAHAAWMAVSSLNLAYHPTHVVLDLGCTRSIGSTEAIEYSRNMHGIMV